METTDFNITGKRLKEIRTESGYTLQEEAALLNKNFDLQITRGMMSRWENGKAQPSSIFLSAYARFHNIDLNYLVGLINIKKPLIQDNSIEISCHNRYSITDEEWSLIKKYRQISTRAQDKIEARIDAEYDIAMEEKHEISKDA